MPNRSRDPKPRTEIIVRPSRANSEDSDRITDVDKNLSVAAQLREVKKQLVNLTEAEQAQYSETRAFSQARREAEEAKAAKDRARAELYTTARILLATNYVSLSILVVVSILSLTFAARVGNIQVEKLVDSMAHTWTGCDP